MFEAQLRLFVEKIVEEKARAVFKEMAGRDGGGGALVTVNAGQNLIPLTAAAARAQVCEAVVRRWQNKGELQRYGRTSRRLVDADELDRFLRERDEPEADNAPSPDEWARAKAGK